MASLYINLLSYDYQRRQVIRACTWQWTLAWLALLPLLIAAGCWQWSRYRSSVAELARVERKHAPLEKLQQETEQLTVRLAELNQREQLVLELGSERPLLDLLGYVSRAAADSGGGVSVRHFTVVRHTQGERETARGAGGPRASAARAPEQRGTLTLEGVGVDNATVARFVSQLRTSDAFAQVHLTSTVPVQVNGFAARSYQMQCAY